MRGRVTTGAGDASGFVEAAGELIENAVDFRPYPGTLNLDSVSSVEELPATTYPIQGGEHCEGIVTQPCRVAGICAAVLRPLVPNYPHEKTELVAPVRLRSLLDIDDGDELLLTANDRCDASNAINGDEIDEFDAVVFDLDGTLLDLAVDWTEVHAKLENLLGPHLDGPLTDYTRTEVFDLARRHDEYDALDELLTTHETEGARMATTRDALLLLDRLDCPVGICTANAEQAARIALERFDVLDPVEAIIARDTIPEDKPHSRTILECLRRLDVNPGNALYVGDEDVDRALAVRVTSSYVHPDQLIVE